MGTAMLTIMAAFAQLERDTMIERTRAGLAAAAANNRHGGRPRKVDDAAAVRARELKGKESVPPTSARCSASPGPRSTDTFSSQYAGRYWKSDEDVDEVASTLVRERSARLSGRSCSGRPGNLRTTDLGRNRS